MLFILIPAGLIAISILGIVIILWRNLPRLKHLSVDEIQSRPDGLDLTMKGFMSDFLPGLKGQSVGDRVKEYKNLWLSELEKFIRKLRLLSLKVDRLSETLIKRIRRVNRAPKITPVGREVSQADNREVLKPSLEQEKPTSTGGARPIEKLKSEEKRLIIEIAKDPKNHRLYKILGELYIEMKNYSDARDSFQAALELNPDDDDTKKKLSLVLENIN